jgi:hypothetical protein
LCYHEENVHAAAGKNFFASICGKGPWDRNGGTVKHHAVCTFFLATERNHTLTPEYLHKSAKVNIRENMVTYTIQKEIRAHVLEPTDYNFLYCTWYLMPISHCAQSCCHPT